MICVTIRLSEQCDPAAQVTGEGLRVPVPGRSIWAWAVAMAASVPLASFSDVCSLSFCQDAVNLNERPSFKFDDEKSPAAMPGPGTGGGN